MPVKSTGYHDEYVANIIAKAIESDNSSDEALVVEDKPVDYRLSDPEDDTALRTTKFEVEEAM